MSVCDSNYCACGLPMDMAPCKDDLPYSNLDAVAKARAYTIMLLREIDPSLSTWKQRVIVNRVNDGKYPYFITLLGDIDGYDKAILKMLGIVFSNIGQDYQDWKAQQEVGPSALDVLAELQAEKVAVKEKELVER